MLKKNPVKIPQGLGPSRKLWKEILEGYEDFEAHHLKLLELICTTWDSILMAKETLKREGCYLTDRYGQLKEHPACVTERQNKALFMRLTRELGLDLAPPSEIGRGKRRY
jgi:P27 family predicted phage terminase small subunit